MYIKNIFSDRQTAKGAKSIKIQYQLINFNSFHLIIISAKISHSFVSIDDYPMSGVLN
jgi:hypothetical protein